MIDKYWSGEDEGFFAICPELAGSSSFGETKQEALAELRDAIAAWIATASEIDRDIPEPATHRVADAAE